MVSDEFDRPLAEGGAGFVEFKVGGLEAMDGGRCTLDFHLYPRGFFRGFCHSLAVLEIKEREGSWRGVNAEVAVKTSIDGPADERLVEVKVLFFASRIKAEMPLADHVGGVSLILE